MNTATVTDIQYISDANGKAVGVIVPISLWREIESEKETAYLLKSETMKTRITEAMKRTDGLSLEDVRAKLGV
jgi:PHD/YefM family antitoxin component YafN of YafNO toxin-antitoxin module